MRKGDQSRQEILRAAERLFCQKGYDETSVQSILDVVHGSKGGFYHHFRSKEQVLAEVCAQRAEAQAERAAAAAGRVRDSLERLNLVLQRMIPLQEDNLEFLSMLIPLLDRSESVYVRVCYQDAIARAFAPLLRAAMDECAAAQLIWPVADRAEEPVSGLVNACWLDVALRLLRDARAGSVTEPAALLDTLSRTRRCVEVLLDAPFGSIVLMPLEKWTAFAEQACRRMRLN